MLLQVENVHKSFRSANSKLEILKGITFEIKKKEVVFITGRSGSGKSTLLNLLGLLDVPDSGSISFEGKNYNKMNDRLKAKIRNQHFGFVFQFYHLLPELNLLENVMLPSLIAQRKNVRAHALELIEQVGLLGREKHFPSQLSGGEQQRGTLVRALMNQPQIVFCDEPTGNLDEESSVVVMDLLQFLSKEKEQAFCVVTHDTVFAKKGDTQYHLEHGVLEKVSNAKK